MTPTPSALSPAAAALAPSDASLSTGDEVVLETHLSYSRHAALLLALVAAQVTTALAGLILVVLSASSAPLNGWLVLGVTLVAAAWSALLPGMRWHAALVRELEVRLVPPRDANSSRARRHLDKIRYQRSVSSGWTSTVKLAGSKLLPLGVEAGATGTMTEADVPLSTPDIVQGITRLLSARGPAVLAVDELDKIDSVDEVDVCPAGSVRAKPCLLDETWLEHLGKIGPIAGTTHATDMVERRDLLGRVP